MSTERVVERKRNPFIRSARGGRTLSALMLPWFWLLPPRRFGVLTTTGRRTGKARRRCVRAVREGDRAYLVAIGGSTSAWVRNVEADPRVRLRLRGGTFAGRARRLAPDEAAPARATFCETLSPMDYLECALHRPGRPTRAKIVELHRRWFDTGTPLVVELER